ncbi:hypothetical protein KGF57_002850 [Candida theae]|uniref:Exonuclease domain-containing protein n=1 Tax=Candida theae TaxID=1198502 RepID=A0AAD5BEA5_9ASCO|nr:uncharacterized protein KGF57_002850 [Candida theae]KAI5958042.1 hypothetical protein KGF57_002850 [Candida theae]
MDFVSEPPKEDQTEDALEGETLIEDRQAENAQVPTDKPQPSKRRRSSVHKKKLKKKNAKPNLVLEVTDTFPVKNVRSLILQVFNCGSQQKWCRIENPDKVKNVCVCFAHGLKELSFIQSSVVKAVLPGSKDFIYDPLSTICSLPLTKNEKKTIMEKSKQEKITIRDLLLSEQQLRELEYPNGMRTKPSPTGQSRIFALDCEFCKASDIHVLTRISLIDFDGNVVFDELVKPVEEITDYVTRYSGITKELLEDVNTSIEQIQHLFLETVFQEDILVGHSLESDLRVMKITHENIVDTAITYEHARGPPSKPSLRWLAKTFLGREIQAGEDSGNGHSSIEDAKACLDLVKLKIQEGKCFGTNVGEVSIFEKLKDVKTLLSTYSSVTNDDAVVETVLEAESHPPGPGLAILELKDLQYNLKWDTPSPTYDGVLDYNVAEACNRTNSRLESIYNSLPENTLFILISQSSDPTMMQKLRKIRGNFQRLERQGSGVSAEESWDINKSDQLVAETAKARESLMFIKIK